LTLPQSSPRPAHLTGGSEDLGEQRIAQVYRPALPEPPVHGLDMLPDLRGNLGPVQLRGRLHTIVQSSHLTGDVSAVIQQVMKDGHVSSGINHAVQRA
jgi:hypothetical protein